MSIGFIENLAGEDEDVEDNAETVEDREGDHQPQEARLRIRSDQFSDLDNFKLYGDLNSIKS